MNKINLLIACCTLATISFAQPIPPPSLEDSTLGWMKVYHFKGAKEPLQVDDKRYSAAQLSICDSFANWMQASYIPKGGLGDVKKAVSTKLGLYNQNDAALPQSYGAYSKTYTELKYNSSHKMEPFTNSHVPWSIMANAVIGYPADIFCTPTQYYFTLPSFGEQGYTDDFPKPYGLATHPNTKKYFSYFRRNSSVGNEKTILLCKDNKLPFIQITKGEYLQLVETTMLREYEKEKKSIYEKEKGKPESINYFMRYLDDKNARRLICLKNNKEKYKNRLQETAEIFTLQPDIMLENYADVFEGNGRSLQLPVYKIDPAVAGLCQKDKPQWIRITWHGDLFEVVGKHQHESIINNFNFDYVYNFFFDPEKVKGQPYKPLRSPYYQEAVVALEASEANKKNKADHAIYFFEDFSTTGIGKKPIGWRTKPALDGTSSVIATPEGLEGHWAFMAGNYTLSPEQLKMPFPKNFTLSYDLVAAQNFTWGAKGLTFQLSDEKTAGNPESYLRLKLRPGFDGRPGEAAIEAKFSSPPGYLNGSKWLVATGFSNNKQNNRITVTIQKKEEVLLLFIDENKIAEYEKAIPAGLLFNRMSFFVNGSSSEHDKLYISNIKITKD